MAQPPHSTAQFGGFSASRRTTAWVALACIALILVSVNVIAGRFLRLRLDLTAEHLYTLSPGTLRTLANIGEPITLRFYYSRKLGDTAPAYGVYERQVRELLDQYVAAAQGKLRLEVFDPQPFSSVEDQAVAFGLQGVPLNGTGEQVYFGLAGTNSTDDQQVIAFFSPQRQRFLEYDLTRLIHSLAVPKKTVVGLISFLPLEGDMAAVMEGRPSVPMAIVRQLEETDTVKPLATDVTKIPADIDVLMLVHPQRLSDKTLFAIDQFVLRGGKAMVFVDPYSELSAAHPNRPGEPGSPTASDLPRLFKSWGIELMPGVVAGDRRDAQSVNVPVPGRSPVTLDYVAWFDLHGRNLNRRDPITADLNHVAMATAGIIEKLPKAKTTLEPLLTTSRDSMEIPVDKVTGMPDVAGLLADFKPSGKRFILAARLSGMVDSAFPKGPPQPTAAAGGKSAGGISASLKPGATKPVTPKATHWLLRSAQPINAIVVADTDLLDDSFWIQEENFFGRQVMVPTADNGDFVANAVDVLAGGEDLIGLRSRGTVARPFVVVDRIRREAEARYSAEEQALQAKLKNTEAKLANLTGNGETGATAALSPQQAKAIGQFRADLLQTRRQLRAVQAALRSNIARLKATLEFVDIALVPILVALVAIVLAAVRIRRRRRRTVEP
jgi:gliding motility-associatede transport system auxiliary component